MAVYNRLLYLLKLDELVKSHYPQSPHLTVLIMVESKGAAMPDRLGINPKDNLWLDKNFLLGYLGSLYVLNRTLQNCEQRFSRH